MSMKKQIIAMLNNGERFKVIFEKLKCTDKEFLDALSEQQQDTYTTVIHDDPKYNGETVAY